MAFRQFSLHPLGQFTKLANWNPLFPNFLHSFHNTPFESYTKLEKTHRRLFRFSCKEIFYKERIKIREFPGLIPPHSVYSNRPDYLLAISTILDEFSSLYQRHSLNISACLDLFLVDEDFLNSISKIS
jgi:hypothetical protein